MRSTMRDSDFRQRLWTIVGISIILISLILVICWFAADSRFRSTSQNRCALLDESRLGSIISAQDQTKVATPDYATLARLVGFVRYSSNANSTAADKYLPLRLQNVTRSIGPNGDLLLILWTECAKLTLILASDSKQLIVGSIDLETSKIEGHNHECQVQSTSIRLPDVAMRYSCDKISSYECRSIQWQGDGTSILMKTVATLEIDSLEFELDGDPTVIRTNQFSKKPATCES